MKTTKVVPLNRELFIHSKRSMLSIPYNNILLAACDKPYIRIECISGKKLYIEIALKDFVAALPPCFTQFARSKVVNLCYVSEIRNTKQGCELLINNTSLVISRRRKGVVQNLFSKIKKQTGGERDCSKCTLC